MSQDIRLWEITSEENLREINRSRLDLERRIENWLESDITILKEDQEVNGKSIMGILMLAAERGSLITIIAEGSDAENAVEELAELIMHDIEGEPKAS